MIISDKLGTIFIHNPKCAGTTVRLSLLPYETRANYYWMFDEINGHKVDKAHLPLSLLKYYNPSDFSLLKEYFVFGFVRNPYQRTISAFNEIHPFFYKKMSRNEIEFDDYRLKLNAFCINITDKKIQGWEFKYRHFIKQVDMYFLNKKCHADLILKLEEIDCASKKLSFFSTEIAGISSLWGSKKNTKKLNYSSVEDLLDQKSIKNIDLVYAEDFDLFDYKKI